MIESRCKFVFPATIENFKKINTLIVCKIRKKLLTLHTWKEKIHGHIDFLLFLAHKRRDNALNYVFFKDKDKPLN